MLETTKQEALFKSLSPVIGAALIIVILDLGMPLDYHLIFSLWTLYGCLYRISCDWKVFWSNCRCKINADAENGSEVPWVYLVAALGRIFSVYRYSL
ncbi:hypothetical protein MGH68_04505 [Erysipelothrix sp. D19-032]